MMSTMTRSFASTVLACLFGVAVGCSKPESTGAAPASSSAAASPAASGSATVSTAPSPEGGATAGAAGTASAWAGTYESAPGTLYVPSGKEYEGVKFRGEKGDVALGKGDLQIAIDPKGTVTGTVEGPLGPGILTGSMQGDTFTAHLYPKDPAGMGFTGTLAGTLAQGTITGKLFASQAEARFIREAPFVLKRK